MNLPLVDSPSPLNDQDEWAFMTSIHIHDVYLLHWDVKQNIMLDINVERY